MAHRRGPLCAGVLAGDTGLVVRRGRLAGWLLLVGVAASVAACRNVLGLADVREAPCVGADCDAGKADDGSASDDALDARSDPTPEACVPVAIENGATLEAGVCAPSDGGCVPRAVDPSRFHWVPPHVSPNACTLPQIDMFYQACMGASATEASCNGFLADIANQKCNDCILSQRGDTTYGALIQQPLAGGIVYQVENSGGCIAALDPCNQPCADLALEFDQCTFDSCVSSCATRDELAACTAQAAACVCAGYFQAAQDCGHELYAVGSPATGCVPMSGTDQNIFELIAAAICAGG